MPRAKQHASRPVVGKQVSQAAAPVKANATELLSVADLLRQVRELGFRCSKRTLWNYLEAGIVPAGRKLPGRGNVLYFDREALHALFRILFLTEHGASLDAIADFTEWTEAQRTSEELPLPIEDEEQPPLTPVSIAPLLSLLPIWSLAEAAWKRAQREGRKWRASLGPEEREIAEKIRQAVKEEKQ